MKKSRNKERKSNYELAKTLDYTHFLAATQFEFTHKSSKKLIMTPSDIGKFFKNVIPVYIRSMSDTNVR